MKGSLRSILVPHRKHTAALAPERIPIPAAITLPMTMHIGAPAKPIVKPGDHVKVGQPVAEAGGFVSAPVHTGVSGTVKRIGQLQDSMGRFVPTVEIEADGLQEIWEGVTPPAVTDTASFLEAVRQSGLVGLGGAGFPTAVKLTLKDPSALKAIILNGAECEPYITSDTRTMLDDAALIAEGVKLLQTYLKPPRVICAIEKNKPQCVESMKQALAGIPGTEVLSLPSRYPQGGEKVLAYHAAGAVVPEGKLPIDAGVVILNVTTLRHLANYMKTGMPLVEKCITVDGSAIETPKNVLAPIGTPVQALLDFCGLRCEPAKILYGGPMMGIAMPDANQPVLKNTNAITVFDAKDATPPTPTACIRCGRCVSACPLLLLPAELYEAGEAGKGEALNKLKINLCMECGCCAYVCPAHRPLVQSHKLAKAIHRTWLAAQKAKGEAQ